MVSVGEKQTILVWNTGLYRVPNTGDSNRIRQGCIQGQLGAHKPALYANGSCIFDPEQLGNDESFSRKLGEVM